MRVVSRIAVIAFLLTAGVKLTNKLFRLLFFTVLGLKVYPRKSNWMVGYLAAAAPICAPAAPAAWLTLQKDRFKSGRVAEVLGDLGSCIEPEGQDGDSPVRACHRYITNRPGQFDCAAAIAANLPIGSGEVESAHRSVIQKRLKLPGAWWRPDRAQDLLNLRCLRANLRWDDYWLRIAA